MDLYAENVLDHYRHPRNQGTLKDATVSHAEKNWSCGDEITMHLRIEDGVIRTVRWEGTGCAISQAAMSLLSEKLEGVTLKKAAELQQKDIFRLLGVPISPRRLQCALIGLHTLKNALRKERGEPPHGWMDTAETDSMDGATFGT